MVSSFEIKLKDYKNHQRFSRMTLPYVEPYKTKMVEPIKSSTRQQRKQWLKESDYKLFLLRSDQVFIDLLTDSGVGAMSANQWSSMMLGDETYAGSSSFYNLKAAIKGITGFQFMLPTHQGRAAENVLFSALVHQGHVIPGNSPFDTTKGHIELRKATVIDCTIDDAQDTQLEVSFKGNISIKKLEQAMNMHRGMVPFILVTITNNTVGGQPVSMANLEEVRRVADRYGTALLLDSARFPENAYFIKTKEKDHEHKSIRQIALEMFALADGMVMSGKKSALVNTGGFIAVRHQEWYDMASTFCIMTEGYPTYGGMTGRDMNAMATGLYEGTQFEVVHAILQQVAHLGQRLDELGIPYQRPVGSHAIFVDASKMLPSLPKEEFPAQMLAIELYLESGVRGCEIGYLLANRDPVTRENRFDEMDFLRLAIPRRVYSNNHMDYVAAALKRVYNRREEIKRGVKIVSEAPIMRHFTVKLEPL